jgi:hypothetical protein
MGTGLDVAETLRARLPSCRERSFRADWLRKATPPVEDTGSDQSAGSMPSAEITSYKPTYQGLSLHGSMVENCICRWLVYDVVRRRISACMSFASAGEKSIAPISACRICFRSQCADITPETE